LGLGFGFFALTEYGVLPPDDLPQPIFDALLTAPLLLQIGWVLMFVLLFPVVEEILFRGFLFTGLAQSWGPTLAAIVTTVLFVAVHMPKVLEYWPALFAVTLIGTFTVFIRIRTGSLAPGIALHSTYNGVLVASALLTQPAS
jgi:membrane protease YdiL (CAAX protease family)